MHSSLIDKIRILKPRKKSQSSGSQLFIIKNDKYHSSVVEKMVDNLSPPPPLVSQDEQNESDSNIGKQSQAKGWMPLYIVNVPAPKPGTSQHASTKLVEVSALASENSGKPNVVSSLKEHGQNHLFSYEPSNLHNIISNITNRELNVTEPITCFLCHMEFVSVNDMQDHYLDKHKQKKKPGSVMAASEKPNSNVKSINFTASTSTQVKKFKAIKAKGPDGIIDDDDSTIGEPKCPICSIYFKTKDEVKEHVTTVHCYKCSECKDSFYTLYQFTDHRCAAYRPNKIKKTKLKKNVEKDPLSLSPTPKVRATANFGQKISIQERQTSQSEPIKILVKPISNSRSRITDSMSKNIQIPMPENVQSHTYDIPSWHKNIHGQSNVIYKPASVVESQKMPNPPIIASRDEFCLSQTTGNASVKVFKSLLGCSLDQLTSREFNKLQLNELIKNPSLSINIIPNREKLDNNNLNSECLSCGRCNVLCENTLDFIDHLQECLRLSNVSLHSTKGPAKKMLNLKVKSLSSKIRAVKGSGINKTLLDQVGCYISIPPSLLEGSSSSYSDSCNKPKPDIVKSNFFIPCIKGNVSINKCSTGTSSSRVPVNLPAKLDVSKMNHRRPPMVVIPIDKSFNDKFSTNYSFPSSHPHFLKSLNDKHVGALGDLAPEISITDKSNHVTYNFINSEPQPVMSISPNTSVLDAFETFIKVDEDIDGINENNTVLKNEQLLLENKTAKTIEDRANENTFDLLLCEEDIKMEVEDEIVTDNF